MKADEQAEDKAKFLINSAYQGFNDRQKSVFDQLNIVEHDTKNLLTKNEPLMDTDDTPDVVIDPGDLRRKLCKNEPKMKHFRGRDSIFKRPQARPPRSIPYRKTPDYQVNPHKWTKYTLDVPNEDMSEKANTTAAMSFLKEIELRKQNENLEDGSNESQKIVFKKITPKKVTDAVETAPVVFRNTKVIMPEYVVGEKPKKEQKQRKKAQGGNEGTTKELKLDHLFDDEDD